MRLFPNHPLVADHKGTDMQAWYNRLRIFINQLFFGENVTAGSNITITPTISGYTISASGGGGSGNLDGGYASTIYGGTTPVDGGPA